MIASGFIGLAATYASMWGLLHWLARRRTLATEIGELTAVVGLALMANAFVCGALSNPHDRYGARMVWLAVFAIMLAIAQRGATHLGAVRKVS